MMEERKLTLTWTNRVEIWRDDFGDIVQRPSVWEGLNQDGEKVRVYIIKVEDIEDVE